MEKNQYIFGIRAVIEAIEAGKEIDKIFIKKDLNGDLAGELFTLVKERGLVTHRVPRKEPHLGVEVPEKYRI